MTKVESFVSSSLKIAVADIAAANEAMSATQDAIERIFDSEERPDAKFGERSLLRFGY